MATGCQAVREGRISPDAAAGDIGALKPELRRVGGGMREVERSPYYTTANRNGIRQARPGQMPPYVSQGKGRKVNVPESRDFYREILGEMRRREVVNSMGRITRLSPQAQAPDNPLNAPGPVTPTTTASGVQGGRSVQLDLPVIENPQRPVVESPVYSQANQASPGSPSASIEAERGQQALLQTAEDIGSGRMASAIRAEAAQRRDPNQAFFSEANRRAVAASRPFVSDATADDLTPGRPISKEEQVNRRINENSRKERLARLRQQKSRRRR